MAWWGERELPTRQTEFFVLFFLFCLFFVFLFFWKKKRIVELRKRLGQIEARRFEFARRPSSAGLGVGLDSFERKARASSWSPRAVTWATWGRSLVMGRAMTGGDQVRLKRLFQMR